MARYDNIIQNIASSMSSISVPHIRIERPETVVASDRAAQEKTYEDDNKQLNQIGLAINREGGMSI
jgi:hypothetical protein